MQNQWVPAGAATIASAGAAVGITSLVPRFIPWVARNPSLAKQSFGYAISILLHQNNLHESNSSEKSSRVFSSRTRVLYYSPFDS